MKSLLTSLLSSLVSFSAIAAGPVTLKCHPVENKELMFSNLSITLEAPDTSVQLPGAWKSQSVTFKSDIKIFDEGVNENPENVTVNMELTQVHYKNVLHGIFEIGTDFGTNVISLYDDFSASEIVVLFDIATDGPGSLDIYRCPYISKDL